jgi:predicted nuclease of predicted toxin-antitoxin system
VKLVFDENLSPRLARVLNEAFPGSTHVSLAGLRGAEDGRICPAATRL